MKTKSPFFFLGVFLFSGCTLIQPEQESIRTEAVVVIDRTDSLSLYPNAATIWETLHLQEHPWQEIQLTFTTAGQTDINPEIVLVLPGSSSQGSKRKRKEQLAQFYTDIQHALEQIQSDTPGMNNSIIFRSLTRSLNTLAKSTASRKLLWVWSDLLELSQVSFYKAHILDLLADKPEQIIAKLEAGTPLQDCPGCQVSFIYRPSNYTDNLRYMKIVEFYTTYFSAHGITVHAGEQPELP